MEDFNLLDIKVEAPPKELKDFLDLAAHPDVELKDIDRYFGWPEGESKRKIQSYPILKELIKETRVMALKALGLNKSDAYLVYKDALTANDENGCVDHEIRMKAADRVLALYGERVTGGGVGQLNVAIQNNDNRVMTVSKVDLEERRKLLDGVVTTAVEVKGS